MAARHAALLALLGCGKAESSASGPDRGADTADVIATCEAVCDLNARCANEADETDDECRAGCADGEDGPQPQFIQQRALDGLRECFDALSCDQSDDSCLTQVLLELDPNFQSSPLGSECLRAQDECGGFSEDSCSYAILFTSAGQSRFAACLSEGCDELLPCLAELFE